jgi:hypothetical protein
VPLSLDTMLVQPANSGSFNAASGAATLPTATTAGTTVLIVVGTNILVSSVTGHVNDAPSQAGTARAYVYRRSNNPGGETSWTVTLSSAGLCRWTVYEVDGLDPDAPLDVVLATQTTSTTSGTTASSGTSPRSTTYDGLVVAAHASYNSTTTTPTTFSGHSGGFTETDEGSVNDGTSKAVDLSVSMRTTQVLGTWETTATASATLSATNAAGALVLVYSAAGAKRDANVSFFWGFKVGAAAGLATGLASTGAGNSTRYWESATGSPAITADGLQLASASSAQNVVSAQAAMLGVPQLQALVERVEFRFDASLPSVDVELLVVTSGVTTIVLRYVTASQKLGLTVGGSSEVLSDATVAAGGWIGVDLRVVNTGVTPNFVWTGNWLIDYGTGPVVQANATWTAGTVLLSAFTTRLGWTAAVTVPAVTFAYLLVSVTAGHYPLGGYTIVLLKADPAGTLTISGTSTNFALMTANATGAAWNAATALTNITEGPPPTIGASAAGFCQTAAAATDYVEVPMETYAAAPAGSVRAVRMLACGWAAAATAATIGFRGWEGSAETTLFATADPGFDNSTTTPAWVCKFYRPTNGWTQAKLDALAFRVGFSDDATPDIGIHALYAEVAVQTAAAQGMFGTAGDVTVSAQLDANSAGILGLATTTVDGKGAVLHYEVSGSPTDVTVPPAGSDSRTLDAPDAPTVGYVAVYPDPEGVPDS